MPPKTAAKPKAAGEHASYQDMISDAIVTLKERNGSSRSALKKYVKSNNTITATDAQFDSLFNKAIRSGVEKGVFAQPKGASGTTKLAKKVAPEKKPAAAKTTTAKTTAKPAAATKKPAAKKATATTTKKAAAPKKTAAAKPKAATTKKAAAAPKKAAPKKAPAKAKKAAAPKAAPAIVDKPTVLNKTKSGRVTKTTKVATPKKPAATKKVTKKPASAKKATPKKA